MINIAVDGKLAGLFAIADPVKPSTPDALKALAADGIKVIMLTGQDANSDVMRGYQSGCFYYIPKPHRLSELLRGLDMATN